MDEFIRVRIYLSEESSIQEPGAVEAELINAGFVIDEDDSSSELEDELFRPDDESFDDPLADESEDAE